MGSIQIFQELAIISLVLLFVLALVINVVIAVPAPVFIVAFLFLLF